MKKKLFIILGICLFITLTSKADNFEEGKHYFLLEEPLVDKSSEDTNRNNAISVTEYFAFLCPGCYSLEREIEEWKNSKPKSVMFNRIPVIFQNSWRDLAKAYYVAKHFKVEEKITKFLFTSAHNSKRPLSREELIALFIQMNVDKVDVENAFQSFALDIQLKQDEENALKGKIFEIPTIIVNNQYKITANSAGGLENMLKVANAVIHKLQKDNFGNSK